VNRVLEVRGAQADMGTAHFAINALRHFRWQFYFCILHSFFG
jgi:hypothetical protein